MSRWKPDTPFAIFLLAYAKAEVEEGPNDFGLEVRKITENDKEYLPLLSGRNVWLPIGNQQYGYRIAHGMRMLGMYEKI